MNHYVDYFSSETLRADLKGKTVRGGAYLAAAQAVTVLTSLASIPVLARLLEPADFGLVAMVTVFTGLAAMFVDSGLSMATIQREQITHQQVSNLFWFATALGLLIAVTVSILSPAIAWFYGESRLVPITIALSASSLFSGLTIQHQALLRRTMQLRLLAAVQVVAFVLGYALAIAAAWYFRSYWALVVLPLSTAALRMAGTWWACEWRPSLPRRGAGVQAMVGFGANLTGFSFVNYFARSGDNLLIGWWWGEVPLGHYERAYKLMMAPWQQINAPLANLLIPALSRLNDRPAKYRDAYLRAAGVFQVVSCPLMAFVAVMAPQIVEVMLGPGFEDAGPILRWLAIAGFVQPLTNSLGWLYISQGRGAELMRWGLLACSLIGLSFILGLSWGPLGVARAYAGMICLIVAPLAIWFAGANGPVGRADLWQLCGTAILLAAPTAVASLFVSYGFRPESALLAIAVAAAASAAAAVPLIICTRFGRSLFAQFKDMAQQLFYASQQTETMSSAAQNSSRAG